MQSLQSGLIRSWHVAVGGTAMRRSRRGLTMSAATKTASASSPSMDELTRTCLKSRDYPRILGLFNDTTTLAVYEPKTVAGLIVAHGSQADLKAAVRVFVQYHRQLAGESHLPSAKATAAASASEGLKGKVGVDMECMKALIYACCVAKQLKPMERLVSRWLDGYLARAANIAHGDDLYMLRAQFREWSQAPLPKGMQPSSMLSEEVQQVNSILGWDWAALVQHRITVGTWTSILRAYEERLAYGNVLEVLRHIQNEISYDPQTQTAGPYSMDLSLMLDRSAYLDADLMSVPQIESIAYHSALRCLCDSGRTQAALKLVGKMNERDIALQMTGVVSLVRIYATGPHVLSRDELKKILVKKKVSLLTLKPTIEVGIMALYETAAKSLQVKSLIYDISKEFYNALQEFLLPDSAHEFAHFLYKQPPMQDLVFDFIDPPSAKPRQKWTNEDPEMKKRMEQSRGYKIDQALIALNLAKIKPQQIMSSEPPDL